MNKSSIFIYLLVLLSFSFTTIKDPPNPKPNTPPVGLPIDGGVSILLFIGTAYGVYKLKKKE